MRRDAMSGWRNCIHRTLPTNAISQPTRIEPVPQHEFLGVMRLRTQGVNLEI